MCAACAVGVWQCVEKVDYRNDFDVQLDYWDLRNSYREHGFLISFVTAFQDLRIQMPEGYSDEEALKLQSRLAQRYDTELAPAREVAIEHFERKHPSVIAIMNESYSDLSLFQDLHDGYTGTYVTRELQESPARSLAGWLTMSVHGGGTCNSEYEFLAASSMGFLGSGMYPYQQFSFAKMFTVPYAFKKLGYGTWGMHPNYPGNWNREFVYADMGIDRSLFIDDFEGSELFHSFVSDRATYKRALDIIEASEEPQFVLDITMQNHGGYDTGSIPDSQMASVHPDFLDDADTLVLNEYLSCIRESDEALEYLLGELESLDEPVAVVFFGDHQPSMSRDYNDLLFPDESELIHKARITKAPYFIWTNYDVDRAGKVGQAIASGAAQQTAKSDAEEKASASGATKAQENVFSDDAFSTMSSAIFLGAQLFEAIGAPLDDYQKALLVLHEQVKAVNTNGYCDADGVWHDLADDESQDSPYHQLRVLHYLNVVRNL